MIATASAAIIVERCRRTHMSGAAYLKCLLDEVHLERELVLLAAIERAGLLRPDAHELAALDLRERKARRRDPVALVANADHPVGVEVVEVGRLLEDFGTSDVAVAARLGRVVHDVAEH